MSPGRAAPINPGSGSLGAALHLVHTEGPIRRSELTSRLGLSRGAVGALVEELRKGRIFAFIDVTNPEPPKPDHPFRKLPNCVLLPHIAGAITNGCRRMGRSIVDQILEFGNGKTTHGEITGDQWKIMA
jgi:hypothetical protein